MNNILKRKENTPISIQISQYHKKTLKCHLYKHLLICANTITGVINWVNKIENQKKTADWYEKNEKMKCFEDVFHVILTLKTIVIFHIHLK